MQIHVDPRVAEEGHGRNRTREVGRNTIPCLTIGNTDITTVAVCGVVSDPRRELLERADPDVAEILTRFFQVRPGGYGEGDTFVGVKLSAARAVAKPYLASRTRPRPGCLC